MWLYHGGLELDLRCPSCDSGNLACIEREYCYLCTDCMTKHEVDAVIEPAKAVAIAKLEDR